MKNASGPLRLRQIVEASLLSTSLVGFIFVIIAAVMMARADAGRERERHEESTHRTLTNLIEPPLRISDYAEVRKILALVSTNSEVVAVVTAQGDFILPDYGKYVHIHNALPPDIGSTGCRSFGKNEVSSSGGTYRIRCTDLKTSDSILGTLLTFDSEGSIGILSPFFFWLIVAGLLSGGLFMLMFRYVFGKRVIAPLEELMSNVNDLARAPLNGDLTSCSLGTAPAEFLALKSSVDELISSARRDHLKINEMNQNAALYRMARQIAHDIRSPLTTLSMETATTTNGLADESRKRIRSAVSSLRDITNALLKSHQEGDGVQKAVTSIAEPTPELLAAIIDPLVSEKRGQYRGNCGIEILFVARPSSRLAFAAVVPVELRRILSNLIDNAVEAIDGKGTVEVDLDSSASRVDLIIRDTGRGIPHEILPLLMKSGASFFKPNGSGLGLSHASTTVQQWNGEIRMESTPGQGTKVVLSLPSAQPPWWFPERIEVKPHREFVFIDDDPIVHDVWRARFIKELGDSSLPMPLPMPKLHFFSGSQPFLDWLSSNQSIRDRLFLLVDYDLREPATTGLSLMERTGLVQQSVLVTGNYDDPAVVDACMKAKMRLLPKGLAAGIPIVTAVA